MRTRLLSGAGVAVVLGLALVALPALPASAKGLSQSQINAIQKELNRYKNVTFEASYVAVNGSQKQTITIAQAPSKSYFGTSNGSAITNGKTTYYCSTNSSSGSSGGTGSTGSTGNSGSTTTTTKAGQLTCIKESGASPLLGVEDLFSPATALAALNQAKEGLVARALGIHISASSARYAGQSATCFSVSRRGQGSVKYCVTNQGLLAYATTANNGANNYFELTKYTPHPSSSLFSLPAGATTVTVPGGGALP